ncbi:VOC family protein [Leifsonia poae]|uniref:VOC family protein n=1 Tax=Leifsonia poae TaxID=110933 RepID=UPI001CBAB7DC|nr:VOC family protein [Leifsonia poae]
MATRIARLTVSVEDLPRALALYRDALGLHELSTIDGLAMLTTDRDAPPGTATEVLLHQRTPTPGDAGVAASFAVTDVDAATIAAVAAGAAVVDEPADQVWGERQSVLRDTDGHILCLVSPLR